MSQINYTPGTGNSPFGNIAANPQASNYGTASGFSASETILIAKAVREAIFDAAPEQYMALRLVFEKDFEEVNLDEFEYLEKTFGRTALEANATQTAQAAVPGAIQTQTLTLTAATSTKIGIDKIIIYPDGTKATITAVLSPLTFTVKSQTGAGLPAIAVGDIFSVQSTLVADGANYFADYERTETITRYNYIQMFLRARRWTRMELLKYQNSGTTNYLDIDRKDKIDQLRVDLFNSFFNGTRGEFQLSSGAPAKSMGGIYPTMVAAGSMTANPTIAGLRTAFETLAFKTNFKKEGGTRMIYATDEMLYELSKIFKDPGTRYAPNDKIADLNLTEYRMGTMKFVPVPCELFKEQSCFPKEWARKILVLDQETISPVKMKGLPSMFSGTTLDKGANGTREDFKDWYTEANLSLRFNNPLGSFYIDVA
jgi:hypothetical protein